MPSWSVMSLEGQPMHAPWNRTKTVPSEVASTNSTSPPSAWIAGRISSITLAMRAKVSLLSGAPPVFALPVVLTGAS